MQIAQLQQSLLQTREELAVSNARNLLQAQTQQTQQAQTSHAQNMETRAHSLESLITTVRGERCPQGGAQTFGPKV